MKFLKRLGTLGKPKVFVIGRNKTGTTSIASTLENLGYRMGDQIAAELLLEDWARGNYQPILDLCRSAQAFQDIPFSLEGTYQAVDKAFPGSRFILTLRNNAATWYESLTRFHTKIVGKGRIPTADDLKSFEYREKGWLWRAQQLVYKVDESTLYDPVIYQEHYDRYNEAVTSYFSGRSDDFLAVNLADDDASVRLAHFLGCRPEAVTVPHLNKSRS